MPNAVGQFVAVIEPQVGNERDLRFAIAQRLRLELILSINAHQAVAEPDRAIADDLAPVRPAMRERIAEPLQVARGDGAAVEPQNAEDCAHAKEVSSKPAVPCRMVGSRRAISSALMTPGYYNTFGIETRARGVG